MTIFFKFLFLFLSLFEDSNYIIYIYSIIYVCFIFSIYLSIKSHKNVKYIFNLFLKFIYIYIFWNLLSEIYFFLDLPHYYNLILIPAFLKFDYISDLDSSFCYTKKSVTADCVLVNDNIECNITTVPFDNDLFLVIKSLVQRIASMPFILTTTTQPLILNWPFACVPSGICLADLESAGELDIEGSTIRILESQAVSRSYVAGVFFNYFWYQEELYTSSTLESTYQPNKLCSLRGGGLYNLNGSNGPNLEPKGTYDSKAFIVDSHSSESSLPGSEGESKDFISPDNLNLIIQKLFHAMNLEFYKYYFFNGNKTAIHWQELFYWLKNSSILSEEEIEKLSLLLKNKDYHEFYKKIPRFLNYHNMLSGYYIFNNNIYFSEIMLKFYHGENWSLIDKSDFIFVLDINKGNIPNYNLNYTLSMFFDEKIIPTFNQSAASAASLETQHNNPMVNYKWNWIDTANFSNEDTDNENFSIIGKDNPRNIKTNLDNSFGNDDTIDANKRHILTNSDNAENIKKDNSDAEPSLFRESATAEQLQKKYFFFSSISDLFNNKLKNEIDINNNNSISNMNLEKCSNFWQFYYFKKFWYFWFIELDIFSFISLNILKKLGLNLNEITPSRFLFAMHLTVVEYLEELDILIKAKIWYEHHSGINPSSLPESTLNEYKDWFLKFWCNQIIAYCKPRDLEAITSFNTNMYDKDIVYLELLENIIFVQSKILESQWTINTIYNNYNLSILSNDIQDDTFLINFYNNIFTLFKKEILDKYSDIYAIRRAYQVIRFNNYYPMTCEDLNQAYLYLKNMHDFDSSTELTSKLNKKNFKNP